MKKENYRAMSRLADHEIIDCPTCGAAAIVVGSKDYNVDNNGKVTETLVWQCQDLHKMHRFETVNEIELGPEVVPNRDFDADPHHHQDKNFANLNQLNQSELPWTATATNPNYHETDARTEDGLTINDGTEGEPVTDAQFNSDGSYYDGHEFSDERPHASELTAGGAVVGDGEDQTLDENRTKKTRGKGEKVKKDIGDDRISADEVAE
jgi:hypothetical protein